MLAQLSILGLYSANPDLWNDMVVPEGLSVEDVSQAIMLYDAELNVLYPDPDFMQLAIQLWSKTRLHAWERIYKALTEDYDPLWNVDGTTTETRTIDSTSSGDSVRSVQGFNSSSFSDATKDSTAGTGKTTETYEQKRGGNIGVTKSQELLESELEVRKTDIYRIIADEFKERFCIMVY